MVWCGEMSGPGLVLDSAEVGSPRRFQCPIIVDGWHFGTIWGLCCVPGRPCVFCGVIACWFLGPASAGGVDTVDLNGCGALGEGYVVGFLLWGWLEDIWCLSVVPHVQNRGVGLGGFVARSPWCMAV